MDPQNHLIYYAFLLVAAILGSAMLINATEKEGIATAGGAVIFVIGWLALKLNGCL